MPQQGRFLTMDTWPGSPYDPATLHKYLYTHADPVNNIDPSGNQTNLIEVAETQQIVLHLASRSATPGIKLIQLVAGACVAEFGLSLFAQLFDDVQLSGVCNSRAPNVMRVQLQAAKSGITLQGRTQGLSMASFDGVKVNTVKEALDILYLGVKLNIIFWFPKKKLLKRLGIFIDKTKTKLDRYPALGISGTTSLPESGTVGVANGIEYRLDIENLKGTNLQKF